MGNWENEILRTLKIKVTRGETMPNSNYTHPELLTDTEWLAEHLGDSNVRILDCGGFEEYRRAHITNAVGIKVHHYIKHPKYDSSPHQYPWVAESKVIKTLMENLGIGDDTQVVVYDANGSLNATRLWWVLAYYGHTNVKVLNGGWKKWFDEGKPISIDPPSEATVTFTPQPQPELICTIERGISAVEDPDTIFLDVRTDEEWKGSNDRGNRRVGHIPGAIHLEWINFLTTDRHREFKQASELQAMLETAGVTPDKNVITY